MCIYGGTHVHKYTKYEVSMSNSVAGEVCTDDTKANDANANDTNANNDGQSMII